MNKCSTRGPMKILLVEDNEHDRAAFYRALTKSELACDIMQCQKAEEALELLRNRVASPDVVVVDFGLPGMSGLDLFRRVHGGTDSPPWVMLTGSGSELLAVEALKAGVSDYVIKDPAQSYLQLLPVILSDVIQRNEEKLARQKAEKALKESEGLLRSVIESLPVGVWLCDAEGRITTSNAAGQKIWGGARYVGSDQFDEYMAWRSDTGKRIEAHEWALSRAMRKGEVTIDEEILIESFDGEKKIILNSALPLHAEDGRLIAGMATTQDITERKRAENLSWALNSIDEIVHSTLNFDGIIEGALTESAKALESESAAISLQNNGVWTVRAAHGFQEDVIGVQMSDEEELHAVLAIKTKRPVAVSDAFNDARVNQKHMQKWNIRSVLVVPLIVKDEAVGVVLFNYHHSCFTFQRAHLDFASRLAASLALALDNARLFERLERDIAERQRLEEKLRRANAQLEDRVADRTKKLTDAIKALEIEIVEREIVEGKLRESREQYSNFIENSLTGIFVEQEGRIVFANERLATIYGYRKEELIGMEVLDLTHPEDRPLIAGFTEKRLQGLDVPSEYDARGITKAGEMIWIQRRNAVIQHEGRPAILANHIDISKRKRMEGVLIESEKKLRFLSRRLLSAQEDERKRIARELHDSIGSSLSGIKYGLENLVERLEPTSEEAKSSKNLINALQDTIEEARRMMSDLRPAMLDDLGLRSSIRWFCRRFQSLYPHVLVEQQLDIREEEVPEHLKIVMFRVIQEALNNIAKYSEAESATVSLVNQSGTFELTVADNGKGFDLESVLAVHEPDKGFGLTSMRERTELSDGSFSIESSIGKGTRIRACWKIGQQAAAVLDDSPPVLTDPTATMRRRA